MSRSSSSRFRRSSLGYSSFGAGNGGSSSALASSAGGGLNSSSAGGAYLSSPLGGGGGGYSGSYGNSYLKNSYAAASDGERDRTTGLSSSAYSSPARGGGGSNSACSNGGRQLRSYGGAATDTSIDALLMAAGISAVPSSSSNAAAASNNPSTPSRAARSYRGARSHSDLLGDGPSSPASASATVAVNGLSAIGTKDPSSSSSSNWRSKSASAYGRGDSDFAPPPPVASSSYGRRERSTARSEVSFPAATVAATSYPSVRDRHYSSSSSAAAAAAAARDDLDRDFQQYVVGVGPSWDREIGGSGRESRAGGAAAAADRSMVNSRAEERGMMSPSRAEYFAAGGRARAILASDLNGGLSEGVTTRSPIMSSAAAAGAAASAPVPVPPPRSASRSSRRNLMDASDYHADVGGNNISGVSPYENNSSNGRRDPFDARGRFSDPFDSDMAAGAPVASRSRAASRDPYESERSAAYNYGVGREPHTPQAQRRPTSRASGVSRSGSGVGLARSSSYRDLRDFEGSSEQQQQVPRRGQRARHQTLAYGVSAADLGKARHNSGGGGMAPGFTSSMSSGASHRQQQQQQQQQQPGDFSDWRVANQVPIVGPATPGVVSASFKADGSLRGFASDMSMGPGGGGGGAAANGTVNDALERHRRRRSRSRGAYSEKGAEEGGAASDPGYSSQPGSRRGSVGVRFILWFPPVLSSVLFWFFFVPLFPLTPFCGLA